MTVEYIRYSIPAEQSADFLDGYRRASEPLLRSVHCLAYEISQCDEDSTSFILRIEWDSAEGHIDGFRKSPEFAEFFAAIKPFLPNIVEMRHYNLTDLHGRKSG